MSEVTQRARFTQLITQGLAQAQGALQAIDGLIDAAQREVCGTQIGQRVSLTAQLADTSENLLSLIKRYNGFLGAAQGQVRLAQIVQGHPSPYRFGRLCTIQSALEQVKSFVTAP